MTPRKLKTRTEKETESEESTDAEKAEGPGQECLRHRKVDPMRKPRSKYHDARLGRKAFYWNLAISLGAAEHRAEQYMGIIFEGEWIERKPRDPERRDPDDRLGNQ